MTPEKFGELWDNATNDARNNGELSIYDWMDMCDEIENFSKINGIKSIEDGGSYTNISHLAFIAGAKWAFARLALTNVKRDSK